MDVTKMQKAYELFPYKKMVENPDWVKYWNGNYWIFLNTKNGTKIRFTDDDTFDAVFPESMDIKITNQCDRGCSWCHENSLPNGKHSDITQSFIDTLHPFQEIAVGGGNVLSHPNLVDFLERLKEKQCLPSITLHQSHFLENIDFIKELKDKNLIYGIGISLEEPTDELITAMQQFPTAVLHTIAGILDADDIEKLSGNHLKILVLGYKDIRRGHQFLESKNGSQVEKNIKWLGENLKLLFDGFAVASFDNLALEQLPVRDFIGEEKWQEFYMGDDGQHTFYIDMVEQEYAMSSTSMNRFDIADKSIEQMFQHVKEIEKEK